MPDSGRFWATASAVVTTRFSGSLARDAAMSRVWTPLRWAYSRGTTWSMTISSEPCS